MKSNGSNRFGGPVWGIVSGIHDMIVYTFIAALNVATVLIVLAALVFVLDARDKIKKPDPEERIPPPPQVNLSPEGIEKRKREYEEMVKEAREIMAKDRERAEAKQLLEEQRKKEAIKAREERSAQDAAHAGLDDFL